MDDKMIKPLTLLTVCSTVCGQNCPIDPMDVKVLTKINLAKLWGLSENFDVTAINKRYREYSKLCHPDHNMNEKATESFRTLTEQKDQLLGKSNSPVEEAFNANSFFHADPFSRETDFLKRDIIETLGLSSKVDFGSLFGVLNCYPKLSSDFIVKEIQVLVNGGIDFSALVQLPSYQLRGVLADAEGTLKILNTGVVQDVDSLVKIKGFEVISKFADSLMQLIESEIADLETLSRLAGEGKLLCILMLFDDVKDLVKSNFVNFNTILNMEMQKLQALTFDDNGKNLLKLLESGLVDFETLSKAPPYQLVGLLEMPSKTVALLKEGLSLDVVMRLSSNRFNPKEVLLAWAQNRVNNVMRFIGLV